MAFSYDVTQLDSNPLYQARFRLGDTDEANAAFQDEEINYSLKCNDNNVLRTCIDCVSALLPRLASSVKFTVGPYSEERGSNAYNYWSKMLDELKAQLTTYSTPIADLPQTPSYFYYGMMGTPESSATDP